MRPLIFAFLTTTIPVVILAIIIFQFEWVEIDTFHVSDGIWKPAVMITALAFALLYIFMFRNAYTLEKRLFKKKSKHSSL